MSSEQHQHHGNYYLPNPSYWPIIGSVAIFCLLVGAANWLHGNVIGPVLFFVGAIILAIMLFGWFGTVISETRAGLLQDPQVDRSFRWGMVWFIFSEIMFFLAFFGALFYARVFSVPWLAGQGNNAAVLTHLLLWPSFTHSWPLFQTPNPALFKGPMEVMSAWGIPAINTAILLTSGVTITIAHWGVLKNRRVQMMLAQFVTILLGIAFLCLQAHEYWDAYHLKQLKLSAGIYGTTFFMLTGFHGLHVTIGSIMLIVILWRMLKGDFNSQEHFGFEAVSWYWHFVDVVWLGLFIFVYWL
ncbi:MAG: cytochrome c oxidase subunit 3 [Proteobacteria bacterium]|nr:cytochrome c oxidase subunit 3 [Pseudomonadota bacterium]